MREFVHSGRASRVVFGTGTLSRVREEVRRLAGSRAMVLSTPGQAELADRVCDELGTLASGLFTGAAMHTPVDVTERAQRLAESLGADCLVAVGGGSTTGLSKALAVRTGIPQVIIPTTYAGSEVTPVLGETENGVKTTRSSPEILPETVVYDVELTLGMPVPLSVTSGINAMAHAVEALYAPQADPATDALALRAISLLAGALPRIVAGPADPAARADALQAAWLAGTCLATVGMGLHHKLCHALGGAFGLPHAQTHTAVLPHAMAYNAPSAVDAMRRVARAMADSGTGPAPDAPTAVYDLITALGGPVSLSELGMAADDIPRAVELAAGAQYPNPRALTPAGISVLLHDAWSGVRPRPADLLADQLHALMTQAAASFDRAHDPRTRRLVGDLTRRLHGFVADNDLTESEWHHAVEFLTRAGQMSGPTRQELILLSDTLGVSSAVDVLTNSRTTDATPSAVLGPFYVDGPPVRAQGDDLAAGLPGAPLFVDVTVTDTAGRPVTDAVVDVWQSNDDGFYDVQLPDLDGPVLRARFRTGGEGRLTFWTIVPVPYPIPVDGPVGDMLTATGRHPYRAPHIHFMLSAPGRRPLTTQLFTAGGEYLDGDAVFGVKNALIVDFPEHKGPTPDGRSVSGPWHRLDYTFRLASDR